jgi:hypothetical protein
MFQKTLSRLGLAAFALCVAMYLSPPHGYASGGSNVETIKVIKCEYAVTQAYVELLISASSSNSSAHLYAYLSNGQLLGEVQNGSGGRYGGTVFVTLSVPATITIRSSSGGSITVPCVPYQP